MDIFKFLDPRTYNYFRVAAFNTKVAIANPFENVDRILRMLEKLAAKQVDYGVSPELSITGYSCGDLFFSQALLKEAESLVLR